MAIDITKSLSSLKARRTGADRGLSIIAKSASFADPLTESYERRTSNAGCRYILGGMEAVDARYTEISYDEGKRVFNRISEAVVGFPVALEFQGSVPLNIHIRGASDIDILIIHSGFTTFDPGGTGQHAPAPAIRPLDKIIDLRKQCETILSRRYYEAKVDTSGAKSITLTGGSFQRKVDVVPSHWHNTIQYQYSSQKKDREIRVLNKHVPSLIANAPFMHMHKISEHDAAANGGTKKVIRLIKNVKEDSGLAEQIALSSYDIASLVWHCPSRSLHEPPGYDLALLATIRDHLNKLAANPAGASLLQTPDGSRKILDDSKKVRGLGLLATGLVELAQMAEREILANRGLLTGGVTGLSTARIP